MLILAEIDDPTAALALFQLREQRRRRLRPVEAFLVASEEFPRGPHLLNPTVTSAGLSLQCFWEGWPARGWAENQREALRT